MAGVGIEVSLPASDGDMSIVERLGGNATTDFGVPGQITDADRRPLEGGADLARLEAVMRGSWAALDAAARAAKGVTLRRGPRGGGRDLAAILDHVTGAEESYTASAGAKRPSPDEAVAEADRAAGTRERLIQALRDGAAGRLPTTRPRSGLYWPPRYLTRRAAWHVLDHAWEIEDRAASD